MSTTTSSLAVVPARGGSKRIPGKNLRMLAGKALLAHTVEAALRSGVFERVVVTTDDPAIADVARECGADVPFVRDASLSDDYVPVSAATVDALERVDPSGQSYDSVCQLMPNCPLRTSADIVDSREQFVAVDAPSQLSVVRYGWQNPWWAMRRDDDRVLAPLFEEALSARSQDLPELYCPTGAVWWARADALRQAGSFYMDGQTGWEIPWARGVDVDTEDDWLVVEVLMAMAGRQRR